MTKTKTTTTTTTSTATKCSTRSSSNGSSSNSTISSSSIRTPSGRAPPPPPAVATRRAPPLPARQQQPDLSWPWSSDQSVRTQTFTLVTLLFSISMATSLSYTICIYPTCRPMLALISTPQNIKPQELFPSSKLRQFSIPHARSSISIHVVVDSSLLLLLLRLS
uniref:Uncharacterized protein n=1 Tax=Arundo donax TaxID=35708 RepID=A0A0A9CVI1_ARUDO